MTINYQYPIPGAQTTNPNAFVADTTHDLGSFDTWVNQISNLTVDYSQLSPSITLTNVSFRVSPGGMPGLAIASATVSNQSLAFQLVNGNDGVAYTLTINVLLITGEIRTDTLTVNVADPNAQTLSPNWLQPATGTAPPPIATSGDGSTFVNTAVRWFVSGTPPVNPNVLDQWYNPTNGFVYQYQSNGLTSQWVQSGEGPTPLPPQIPPTPIVPPTPAGAVPIIKMYPIQPNGTAQTFNLLTLDGTPVNITVADTLFVFVDGVWQEAGAQYSTTSTQIVFFTAPAADSNIWILWFSPGASAMTTNIVKMAALAPDGTLTNFTLTDAAGVTAVSVQQVNTLFVSQDGVWQEPSVQFTAAGNQISFTTAPSADSYIFILWFNAS